MAKAAGFEVSQSDYYFDPDGGEPREIDLVLSVQEFQKRFDLSYTLFVECKSSRDKPWLLFCTPNEVGGDISEGNRLRYFHLSHAFIANDLADTLIFRSIINGSISNLFPRLNTEPLLGYGVTQAFAAAGDAPFKAMMSATKAALSHTKRFGMPGLTNPFLVSIPVIVIDVPLLAVSFSSETNELQIQEVRRGNLYWKHVVGGRSRIGVYIVTKPELPAFLADCFACANWWTTVDESVLTQIYNEKLDAEKSK